MSCHSKLCFCSREFYKECQFDKYDRRIDTNILISGYIRQQIEIIHNISIPTDTKDLCFNFWYLTECPNDLILYTEFDEMNLKPNLVEGIYEYGLDLPSKGEQQAIIPLINGQNMIVQASDQMSAVTFCIAALQKVNLSNTECQVLIMTYSTEYAKRISKTMKSLGIYMNLTNSSVHVCTNDTPIRDENNVIKQGKQIIIAPLPRVNDMINRDVLTLQSLQLLIMDGTDQFFSRGFKDQIYECTQFLPSDIQGMHM